MSMEYLGSLGRLVALRCASTESVGAESRYSHRVTMGGVRRSQVRPFSPRSWDVSWAAASNPDVAALEGFTSGAFGNGPWHWVSVQAQHGNMLTPRESMLLDYWPTGVLSIGGSIIVNGVRSPLSMLHNRASGWTTAFRDIPVLPGRPVTWSAEVNSAGGVAPRLVLTLLDASGAAVSNTYGTGTVSSAVQRVSVTVTPPSNAVAMHASLDYTAVRMIRPQVTWTDGPVPYSAGHGCRSAVVDIDGQDLLYGVVGRSVSGVGFRVLEVG